jgi:hypothetical protein
MEGSGYKRSFDAFHGPQEGDNETYGGQKRRTMAASPCQPANYYAYSSQSNDDHIRPGEFRWWIPAEGIRRDVIQADISLYLGPDALVKPGTGVGSNMVMF